MKLVIVFALCFAGIYGSVLKKGNPSNLHPMILLTKSGQDFYFKTARWNWIIPGTKWCGDGDIAKDYDDLGFFEETDKCCRDHDHCEDFIVKGENKYGLKNEGSFTRLHCKCDQTFLNCLRADSSLMSKSVGFGYFTALNPECFDETYPASCNVYDNSNLRPRCVDYSYNTTEYLKWQWFDLPIY